MKSNEYIIFNEAIHKVEVAKSQIFFFSIPYSNVQTKRANYTMAEIQGGSTHHTLLRLKKFNKISDCPASNVN